MYLVWPCNRFSSTADSATIATGSVTKLRKESSFAERTALVRRQTQGLEDNEDWAQVAVYSDRTGLDGKPCFLVQGDFVD